MRSEHWSKASSCKSHIIPSPNTETPYSILYSLQHTGYEAVMRFAPC
jgi:hypothetical protein